MIKDRAARPRGEAAGVDFWAWSLARYERRGVAALCLRLQDEFAFNVNIVLWSCWCAERYEAPSPALLHKACEGAELWNMNVTGRLRDARRFMKEWRNAGEAESLRTQIKAAELDAEKIEQSMLEAAARSLFVPAPLDDPAQIRKRALTNLTNYADHVGAASRSGFDLSLLHALIDRIFGAPPHSGPEQGSST